jgi:hypothetical protein
VEAFERIHDPFTLTDYAALTMTEEYLRRLRFELSILSILNPDFEAVAEFLDDTF